MDKNTQLAMFGLMGVLGQSQAQPVPNNRLGRLIKPEGTSATGSITKTERQKRNLAKKRAKLDRKRNRR